MKLGYRSLACGLLLLFCIFATSPTEASVELEDSRFQDLRSLETESVEVTLENENTGDGNTNNTEDNEKETHNESENDEDSHEEGGGHDGEGGHETHAAYNCLFPSLTLTLGVFIFLILSRYAEALPYTAVMFLVGCLMGMGAQLSSGDHQLNVTIRLWGSIDSEVLLLVFLPGLIFKDAMGQNVHLFRISLVQCLIFAFPMVLMGTGLTACIAYYIFPYGWSFNLAMTFGAILSATDPVAVAALLESVGAPPRLKVHIAGESLLNDGSAIVFFSIFFARFLNELEIPGLGEDVGWAKGIAMFFQKSLGGVAIGIFFGMGLLQIILLLSRRFNHEENVVEVSATMAIAYVGYYVAEPVWQTSGVIATVTSGVLVKFFGRHAFNNVNLLDDFWTLVEHILNTVLFTLGGVVWGAIVAEGEKSETFKGRDWGYLIMLYALLTLIRGFLFFLFFPITKRIGLKTNWKEQVFQVHGGLRGAVGIALAIAVYNEVEVSGADPVHQEATTKLFAFVGGIAFLTLTINGTTAGPLLRYLGLADSTETREKIIDAYNTRFRTAAIEEVVRLLTQKRFWLVNFGLVKHHIPYLADLTKEQLMEAVEKYEETTPEDEYVPPYLGRILPYLNKKPIDARLMDPEELEEVEAENNHYEDPDEFERKLLRMERAKKRKRRRRASTMRFMMQSEELSPIEHRQLFLSILRAAYEKQIASGELESRQVLAVTLFNGLDLASDAVANGEPLKDWEFTTVINTSLAGLIKNLKSTAPIQRRISTFVPRNERFTHIFGQTVNHQHIDSTLHKILVERSLAFMDAHRFAQDYFRKEFANTDKELSDAGAMVIAESQREYKLAEDILKHIDHDELVSTVSHKFCSIILNGGIHYISKLCENGLLKEQEAEHVVHEIEEYLEAVGQCDSYDHPGEIDFSTLISEHGKGTSVEESDDPSLLPNVPNTTAEL